MNAAITRLWPHDDPLFDLNPPGCARSSHRRGPCPVEGLEAIVEELDQLALDASARRDARLELGEYGWQVIAEDAGVRVVIPA